MAIESTARGGGLNTDRGVGAAADRSTASARPQGVVHRAHRPERARPELVSARVLQLARGLEQRVLRDQRQRASGRDTRGAGREQLGHGRTAGRDQDVSGRSTSATIRRTSSVVRMPGAKSTSAPAS